MGTKLVLIVSLATVLVSGAARAESVTGHQVFWMNLDTHETGTEQCQNITLAEAKRQAIKKNNGTTPLVYGYRACAIKK